ncbi:MAG: polyprenyl synthetase family protein [Clostridia bacterium]|nr:polyprenyl synthetase family protein [Clostridia bacterium]
MIFELELKLYLDERKRIIDEALDKILYKPDMMPGQIHQAMRYSVFAGGKRLRPILCLAACEAVGGKMEEAIPVGCALELIHTYSLIHVDLPAMDDDDLRRGKPTNHIVFGEALAILAGDALLTYAFEIIADLGVKRDESKKYLQVGLEIAKAAGTQGMLGGQVVDILSENQNISPETLYYIHHHKTGALIKGSLKAGAIIGGGNQEQIESLLCYGENLGLAFQITDDLLDIYGDVKKTGKPVGSDDKNQKATFPSIFGIEKSKIMASEAIEEACKALNSFGSEAEPLRLLAKSLINRES